MTPILIGLISSILTSIVKWLNSKLESTPALRGTGAMIVSIAISFIGAVGYLYWNDMLHFANKVEMLQTFTVIYTTADLYYRLIIEKLFKRN
jgi:hypothetical protein